MKGKSEPLSQQAQPWSVECNGQPVGAVTGKKYGEELWMIK